MALSLAGRAFYGGKALRELPPFLFYNPGSTRSYKHIQQKTIKPYSVTDVSSVLQHRHALAFGGDEKGKRRRPGRDREQITCGNLHSSKMKAKIDRPKNFLPDQL